MGESKKAQDSFFKAIANIPIGWRKLEDAEHIKSADKSWNGEDFNDSGYFLIGSQAKITTCTIRKLGKRK